LYINIFNVSEMVLDWNVEDAVEYVQDESQQASQETPQDEPLYAPQHAPQDQHRSALRISSTRACKLTICPQISSKIDIFAESEKRANLSDYDSEKISHSQSYSDDADDDDDSDYEPGFLGDSADSDEDSDQDVKQQERQIFGTNINNPSQQKYIVYEGSLFDMLNRCRSCGLPCQVFLKKQIGSWAAFETHCKNCLKPHIFQTQPMDGRMPLGNLESAAAMLFCGASPAQLLNFCKILNVFMISRTTFLSNQKGYLLPSVRNVWKSEQEKIIESLQGKKSILGGDGRSCSPGHTAKYTSYCLMELNLCKILDVRLVQVTEANNSNAMELVGLKRCLDYLRPRIDIESITTDRHSSIQKYLREEGILQYFDVWHVAKNVGQKIDAVMNKGPCHPLVAWKNPITNHMYWSACSSEGDGAVVEQKWLSLLNHVVNVHTHTGPKFLTYHQCEHSDGLVREWLDPKSIAYRELQQIVSNPILVKAVRKLSPGGQTSSVESYHNIVTHFAPKRLHYFNASMRARIEISALHFNENSNKLQALTADNNKIHGVSYPKGRRGQPVVKRVTGPATHDYTKLLLAEVFRIRQQFPTLKKALAAVAEFHKGLPPPVCSKYKHVPTSELLEEFHCRYNRFNRRTGVDLW
jgi:hypothetical protein